MYLYSNEICNFSGLEYLTALRELILSDNNITKVEGCNRLPNLELLSLSQNPLNDLDDIKDISNLPHLKSLDFGVEDFAYCNICEIKGYKDFVLTTATSPYLEQIDGE